MHRPRSTYRLQITPQFTLHDAATLVPYLFDLGVDTVYLSPILTAATGSDHGYDVVDVTTIDPARGGPAGLDALAAAAHDRGMGVMVDIVPNHMGIATPHENRWWWDVLRAGRASEFADVFDIDWDAQDGKILVPILGDEFDRVAAGGELIVDREAIVAGHRGVVRYGEHVLPLSPQSASIADLQGVLAAQHWRLAFWQREATELNYRRFFAVSTLAAVRVEDPQVFDLTHAEIIRWVRSGLVDALRVDHPDGLADPGAYLDRLQAATGCETIVVEKILEHSATDHPEPLPGWWMSVGTTGYDAMAEIDRVLIDPDGEDRLTALDSELRGGPGDDADIIHDAKRGVADTIQQAEISRLLRLLPSEVALRADARDALAELLTAFPVYRAYLPAGTQYLDQALDDLGIRRPDLRETAGILANLVLAHESEFSRRFMQTTGPVMAKGVEDTAFYRLTRLGSLTEVGGDPSVFSLSIAGFHRAWSARHAHSPRAMTALSTHDTKRSEDVRARLSVLSEMPERWAGWLRRLRAFGATGNGPFDALLWQAIIGAWPADAGRLHAYAEKAAREASEETTWTQPDQAFEARVHNLVDSAFGSARETIIEIVEEIAPAGWANGLAAKLLQLTGPGVPDVYQGSEYLDLSLVDPDNRRPVDFAARQATLALGIRPAKQQVTAAALRLRRDHPELFTRYRPVTPIGAFADHIVAFDTGGAISLASRFYTKRTRGWDDTSVLLPASPERGGRWRDVLTDRDIPGGEVPASVVFEHLPVALLAATEPPTAASDPSVTSW